MELNRQEFSHWGEVKGNCAWELSLPKKKKSVAGEARPKLLFSALFKRSLRPIDPFVSSVCWSGLDLDTLKSFLKVLSRWSARLPSVSLSLQIQRWYPVIPVGDSEWRCRGCIFNRARMSISKNLRLVVLAKEFLNSLHCLYLCCVTSHPILTCIINRMWRKNHSNMMSNMP